jgi:hypothetical protein
VSPRTRKPSEAVSLAEILLRNQERLAPDVSPDFLRAIAEIQERNQFDDDRAPARREMRSQVEMCVEAQHARDGGDGA